MPTCGGSGSWWIDALLTGRPGLLARHHAAAGAGIERRLTTAEHIADVVPEALLQLIAVR